MNNIVLLDAACIDVGTYIAYKPFDVFLLILLLFVIAPSSVSNGKINNKEKCNIYVYKCPTSVEGQGG